MSAHVAIISDGYCLIWGCQECEEGGMGSDSMNNHMIRVGHDWFEVSGTTVKFF